jgi:hypothetical protein
MAKRTVLLFATICFLVSLGLLCSCAQDAQKKEEGAKKPQPGPEKFIQDYEKSDQSFTLMAGMKKGESPHGKVRVWYSKNLDGFIDKEKLEKPVPVGTVAIKPFDNDGKEGVDGIAVMIKKEENYDQENSNWYYEMRDAKGKLLPDPPAGRIKKCIECHAKAKDKDCLLGSRLR